MRMELYDAESSGEEDLQPVTLRDLHPQETEPQLNGSFGVGSPHHPADMPSQALTACPSATHRPTQICTGDEVASSEPAGASTNADPAPPDVTFSWGTCVSCVVALTMRQHPSPVPSETWALPALQNNVFRVLLQCAVEATSLSATLGEINVRLIGEGLSEEHAAALTSTLRRWYVTTDPPGRLWCELNDGAAVELHC